MKLSIFFLLSLLFIPFSANAADAVEGFWLTQNKRSVIQIEQCDAGLCGYVYWIIDGGLQRDEYNPDKAHRNDPICGMRVLWGFDHDGAGEWSSGRIYKADDGDTYHANVELQSDGTLRLRGYVGVPVFGKTQIWNRVDKSEYKACRPPA